MDRYFSEPTCGSAAEVLEAYFDSISAFLPTSSRTALLVEYGPSAVPTRLPWPLASLAFTSADGPQLADRIQQLSEGRYGTPQEWQRAESEWIRDGIDLDDELALLDPELPFDVGPNKRFPLGGVTWIFLGGVPENRRKLDLSREGIPDHARTFATTLELQLKVLVGRAQGFDAFGSICDLASAMNEARPVSPLLSLDTLMYLAKSDSLTEAELDCLVAISDRMPKSQQFLFTDVHSDRVKVLAEMLGAAARRTQHSNLMVLLANVGAEKVDSALELAAVAGSSQDRDGALAAAIMRLQILGAAGLSPADELALSEGLTGPLPEREWVLEEVLEDRQDSSATLRLLRRLLDSVGTSLPRRSALIRTIEEVANRRPSGLGDAGVWQSLGLFDTPGAG